MTATGLIEPTVTTAHPEPEDFGELFERHARPIYGFCFRRTGNWATAEDLTSIVFLEAWRRRGSVDLVREPALPWLLGVANNVTRNHARSLRRHRRALARVPAPQATPDFADAAAERLDDEERTQSLIEHLRALPRREREVIELCTWAGQSYEDAARALDVPVGTVRSRLARGRARLQEKESA